MSGSNQNEIMHQLSCFRMSTADKHSASNVGKCAQNANTRQQSMHANANTRQQSMHARENATKSDCAIVHRGSPDLTADTIHLITVPRCTKSLQHASTICMPAHGNVGCAQGRGFTAGWCTWGGLRRGGDPSTIGRTRPAARSGTQLQEQSTAGVARASGRCGGARCKVGGGSSGR